MTVYEVYCVLRPGPPPPTPVLILTVFTFTNSLSPTSLSSRP